MGHDPAADWPAPPFRRDRNHLLVAAERGYGTVDLRRIDFQSELQAPLAAFDSDQQDTPAIVAGIRRTACEQALFYRAERERLVRRYGGELVVRALVVEPVGVDHGAGARQPRLGQVVVDHDHVEPGVCRVLQRVEGADPAIDGDDHLHVLRRELAHGGAVGAVALAQAVGDVDHGRRAEAPPSPVVLHLAEGRRVAHHRPFPRGDDPWRRRRDPPAQSQRGGAGDEGLHHAPAAGHSRAALNAVRGRAVLVGELQRVRRPGRRRRRPVP